LGPGVRVIGTLLGQMVAERVEGGGCAPLAHTLPPASPSNESKPADGTAVDSDSATTGIRWLTSALVTSVRLASAMAWAGSPRSERPRRDRAPPTSRSRGSEFAMTHLPSNRRYMTEAGSGWVRLECYRRSASA
jgi:hypothetical protein